jgi:hypothetical protein
MPSSYGVVKKSGGSHLRHGPGGDRTPCPVLEPSFVFPAANSPKPISYPREFSDELGG